MLSIKMKHKKLIKDSLIKLCMKERQKKSTYVSSTWQQLYDFQVCHGNDPVALATLNQMPLCQWARQSSGGQLQSPIHLCLRSADPSQLHLPLHWIIADENKTLTIFVTYLSFLSVNLFKRNVVNIFSISSL